MPASVSVGGSVPAPVGAPGCEGLVLAVLAIGLQLRVLFSEVVELLGQVMTRWALKMTSASGLGQALCILATKM